MTLTYEEAHSALWFKLTQHYAARLELLRARNDGELCAEETARLRGRIAEVKSFLAFSQEETVIDAD